MTSVLYKRALRGCAIPVAWRLLLAGKRGGWIEPILELLSLLAPAVPKKMTVLVMTDRGLWGPRLWQGIRAVGWHPLMRLQGDTIFQPVGGSRKYAMHLASGPGHAWVGDGTVFGKKPIQRFGTLVVMWDHGRKEPWIVLTDLSPQ